MARLLAVFLTVSAVVPASSAIGTIQSTTAAPGSMTVTTKAVELKVESVETAAQIDGRKARAGHEFVIVTTSWKNIIAPQSTTYAVPMLSNHLWLLTDGRYADTVDLQATAVAPNHLANGFGMAKFGDVLRGAMVFEVPAGAKYRALQFFDNENGHALIPLGGTKPAAPAAVGAMRENDVVQLAVSEAGFGPAGRQAPAGRRYYTVTLRGMSKSPKDIVNLPIRQSVFLQNDRGCVSEPENGVTELTRPLGDTGSFLPSHPNEGQVAFVVPDDTKTTRVLITPARNPGIVLPAGPDFTPAWPTPATTIEDGTTMRVLVLPAPAKPPTLPAPPAGRQYVLLDVVAQNLKANQGIELDGTQQLRLVAANGTFMSPSPISNQLACRLGDIGVIPAGHSRRFQLVYDAPAGAAPAKLEYRGFEKDQVVDIKR